MPRVPREPNPPGTRMPCALSRNRAPFSLSSASASTQFSATFRRFPKPPWKTATFRLLYESSYREVGCRACSRAHVEPELPDRLEERHALDVAAGSADLDDHDVQPRRPVDSHSRLRAFC